MRALVLSCLFIGPLAATLAADSDRAAIEVVDRAIKAIGGEAKVAALKAGTWKTKSVVQGKDSSAEFHGELPGKFRIDSQRVVEGRLVPFSRVVDGDAGFVIEGGAVRPMTAAEVAGVRDTFRHKHTAVTLLPLKAAGVDLKSAGETVSKGTTLIVVRAAQKGAPDQTLYFDKGTGLLVRSEITDTDPKTAKSRKVEITYDSYNEFDGIRMATRTKTYHDGKLFIDATITEFKGSAGALPAGTFAKP